MQGQHHPRPFEFWLLHNAMQYFWRVYSILLKLLCLFCRRRCCRRFTFLWRALQDAIFDANLLPLVYRCTLGLTTYLLILNTKGQISRSPGVIQGQIFKPLYLKNCAAQDFHFFTVCWVGLGLGLGQKSPGID